MVDFRQNKNKSVRAAAKSLINFFRDVCPQLLPKKYVGRFTEIVERDEPVYGQQKLAFNVEGIELLKQGEGIVTERFLTDDDLKRIRILKLRKAVRQVDRKGFRSSDEEEESGAEEMESDMEGGEDEMMSEGGESEIEEANPIKKLSHQHLMQGSEGDADAEMGESDMDEYSFEEEGES